MNLKKILYENADSCVHLCIDSQLKFKPDRRRGTGRRKFADDLALMGIPTIWIAYGNVNPPVWVWAIEAHEYQEALFQKLGDTAKLSCKLRPGEKLFFKSDNSAFGTVCAGGGRSVLGMHLQSVGCKYIIISGGNTRGCVFETIKGALKTMPEAQVIIVSDLLSDVWMKAKCDKSVGYHRAKLKNYFWNVSRVKHTTSDAVFMRKNRNLVGQRSFKSQEALGLM